MTVTGENISTLEKNLPQCHFVYQLECGWL